MKDRKNVGVVVENSVTYVEAIFNCYQNHHAAVLLRTRKDKRIEDLDVSEIIEPDSKKGWFTQHIEFSNAPSLAQISFTSGTEGEPKGVLLSHEALSDVALRLNEVMETDSSIREYVGVPANYSFGLGRFRAVATIGGHSYLPEYGFNPVEIKDMLQKGEINAVSTVPSLWRVLLKNKSLFGSEALKLKWIEIGSQYMSRQEKESLKLLFPNAIIAQHYGLTEASRTTFLRIDQVEGAALESVGTTLGQTEIKIMPSGRICIRGPHVAKELLIGKEYLSNVDEDDWLETSDLGRIQDDYLYYLGRADDLINCGGIKLSPDAIERDISESLGVKEGIAVTRIDDDLAGNAVLVAFLSTSAIKQQSVLNVAFDVLATYGVNNKSVLKTLIVDQFPVTETGKLRRKQLATLYHEQSGKPEEIIKVAGQSEKQDITDEEKKIQSIWQGVLNLGYIDIDSSFYQLGGDSLTAISALIDMESKGIPKDISKGMLQGLTIREIAALLDNGTEKGNLTHKIRTPELRYSMSVNIIRGFMTLMVVLSHWHYAVVERLPLNDPDTLLRFFAPFFSIGTPGFAVIYGVGVGYSLYPIYQTDPERLKGILRKTLLFLFCGIVAMGAVIIIDTYLKMGTMSFTEFMNSFYSVLTYYFLISATLYFWFKLVSWSQNIITFSFLLAICLYSIHVFGLSRLGSFQTEGIVEFVKLLFFAKYSYFLMLSGTFLGIGIGIHSYDRVRERKDFSHFSSLGLASIILGLVISAHAGSFMEWTTSVSTNLIWRWCVYSGVILILLASLNALLQKYNGYSEFKKSIFQFFSVMGMLAFPLFVWHEMTMPIKSIIVSLGGNETISLLLSLSLFLAVSYLMFRKVYSFSFS